jgi:putative oxidoreductase
MARRPNGRLNPPLGTGCITEGAFGLAGLFLRHAQQFFRTALRNGSPTPIPGERRGFLNLGNEVVIVINRMRWTQRVSFVVAVIMVVGGMAVLLSQRVTLWFTTSAAVRMLLLLAPVLWLFRGSFGALAAAILTTTVVGRLFSTVQISSAATGRGTSASDLLLQVETGPGVPALGYLGLLLGILLFAQFVLLAIDSIQTSKGERDILLLTWAFTFARLYVGLMFVPHFVGHIFAGPHQFAIYTQYFAGLGLPLPTAQLVLAGAVEVIAPIGLTFGICTRPLAFLGAVYLFLTMLLGGHFPIGYVWILPDGGYEFGVFWAVMVTVFIITGGGPVSLDNEIRRTLRIEGRPGLRAGYLLFA